MPLPSLPADVLHLVFNQLASDGRSVPEQQGDILRLMRVCKAWREVAEVHLFRRLEIDGLKASRLLEVFKARVGTPHLVQDVTIARPAGIAAWQNVLLFLESLTNLRRLRWDTPWPRTLVELELACPHSIDFSDIPLYLNRLPNLRAFTLNMSVGMIPAAVRNVQRLQLERLILRIQAAPYYSPNALRLCRTWTVQLFNFATLQSFTTICDLADADLHTSLAAATSLRSLHLTLDDNTLYPGLPRLASTLQHLPHLETLVLSEFDEGQPCPSSALLSTLLSSLPLSLKRCSLSIPFSPGVERDILTSFLTSRLDAPLKELDHLEEKQPGRMKRIEWAKTASNDGTKREWVSEMWAY
ncbi:hypothetical protein JCM10207_000425 [Rhodosporidiobolus poonsookiae]